MNFAYRKTQAWRMLLLMLCFILTISVTSFPVFATQDELTAEAEERKNNPVESNEIPNWPQGPSIGAESAILMDADTGAILYAKNIDAHEFPASTTKIMTSLVAVENADLNEMVTVNQSAIDANAPDGSNMGLRAGEQLTMEEILYGILINSANEGCNAVAEHIAGSIDAYVEMMNRKAAELGCNNTHFVTANGLHDEEHYTCARDLALIARQFFSYDILCTMSDTPQMHIEATATHEEHYLSTHNKLLPGMDYEYEYLVGSKTGFTSNSRQCLVSCAEKNGVKLICVIMKEESPYQFEDTIALFDYGFSNFNYVNIAQNETSYNNTHADFFNTDNALFGSSSSLISLDPDAYVVLPSTFTFANLQSQITTTDDGLAQIDYYYDNNFLGSAKISINRNDSQTFPFSQYTPATDPANAKERTLMDVKKVIFVILAILVLAAVGYIILRRLRVVQKRKTHRLPMPGNITFDNILHKRKKNGLRSNGKAAYNQVSANTSEEEMRFDTSRMQSITRPGMAAKNDTSVVPNLAIEDLDSDSGFYDPFDERQLNRRRAMAQAKESERAKSGSSRRYNPEELDHQNVRRSQSKQASNRRKKRRKKKKSFLQRTGIFFQELFQFFKSLVVKDNDSFEDTRMLTEDEQDEINRQIFNQRMRENNIGDYASQRNRSSSGMRNTGSRRSDYQHPDPMMQNERSDYQHPDPMIRDQKRRSQTYGNTSRRRNDFDVNSFKIDE